MYHLSIPACSCMEDLLPENWGGNTNTHTHTHTDTSETALIYSFAKWRSWAGPFSVCQLRFCALCSVTIWRPSAALETFPRDGEQFCWSVYITKAHLATCCTGKHYGESHVLRQARKYLVKPFSCQLRERKIWSVPGSWSCFHSAGHPGKQTSLSLTSQ